MADNEIRDTLEKLRQIKAEIAVEFDKPGLPKAKRKLLRDAYNLLLELDEFLVLEDLNKRAEELVEKSRLLLEINKEIQEKIADLKQLAQKIESIAKAINLIAKGFGIFVAMKLK